jgi:hypothetical protein
MVLACYVCNIYVFELDRCSGGRTADPDVLAVRRVRGRRRSAIV